MYHVYVEHLNYLLLSYGANEANLAYYPEVDGAERTVNTAHIRVSRQFLTECFWRKSSCESVKMSKVQTLRVFMKQRLTAAAEEIFELFERTIAEYEEELCRQRKLLDALLQLRCVRSRVLPLSRRHSTRLHKN